MRKLLVLVFCLSTLTGCTFNFWYKDFVTPQFKLYPPKFQLLTLGNSKKQVVEALGEPDQIIGAKKQDGKVIETWEYIRVQALLGPDQIGERYYVEFTNGILSSYGSSGDFKQQINIR